MSNKLDVCTKTLWRYHIWNCGGRTDVEGYRLPIPLANLGVHGSCLVLPLSLSLSLYGQGISKYSNCIKNTKPNLVVFWYILTKGNEWSLWQERWFMTSAAKMSYAISDQQKDPFRLRIDPSRHVTFIQRRCNMMILHRRWNDVE